VLFGKQVRRLPNAVRQKKLIILLAQKMLMKPPLVDTVIKNIDEFLHFL
jgi:hypothetical protein